MNYNARTTGRQAASNFDALRNYERGPVSDDYVLIRDAMVPMRDGVRLATDIYLPAKDGMALAGKFPTILDRTPYDKVPRAPLANDPEYFARRGYAFVFQDSRGHGNSEGEFSIYVDEGKDGYDTVEWIAKQDWCNGKVGTSGYSYDAATQHALAREAPPHLAAMFPAFGTSNYHNDCEAHGGAFRLAHNLNYSLHHAEMDRLAKTDPVVAANIHKARSQLAQWLTRPLSEHFRLFRLVPEAEKWYRAWVDHPDFDDYWKQNGYYFEGFHADYPDVPVFHMGGYYDFLTLGTVRNYAGLKKAKTSPQFLLLGPWTHGPLRSRSSWQGAVEFHAGIDWTPIRLAFFDHFLMGIDTGLMGADTSVTVFVGGGGTGKRDTNGHLDHGGRFITAPSWPLPDAKVTAFHLHDGGRLAPEAPKPKKSGTSFEYDPKHPCPQVGGDYNYAFTQRDRDNMGPQDQVGNLKHPGCTDELPLASRPDVLIFETEPLEEDVEVVGPMSVELFVSTDAPDTDFTAKLIDQYPPSMDYPCGFALILRDSIIRLRYRKGLDKADFVKPGEVVPVTIDLWMTGNRFVKGHRIRLDISSSNYPNYDPNPNSGEPIGYHTHTRIARNTVHHDSAHPSKLMLPILKS
jgi:putative CocE/NonD family hydrolase